jgi:hypothetical protein
LKVAATDGWHCAHDAASAYAPAARAGAACRHFPALTTTAVNTAAAKITREYFEEIDNAQRLLNDTGNDVGAMLCGPEKLIVPDSAPLATGATINFLHCQYQYESIDP